MALSKPRVITSMLAVPAYEWIKAVCAARLGWHFIPATDTFFHIVIAAFALVSDKKNDPKPPVAP